MIEREFMSKYRDVDAVVVTLLWDVYRHSTWDQRANVTAALDRVRERHELGQYLTRQLSEGPRSMTP